MKINDPINKAWHEKFVRPTTSSSISITSVEAGKQIKDALNEFSSSLGTPKYYDNSKGSLYQIGLEQGWNSYQQDLIKRISRCEKKGEFFNDLNKTKVLIDLYIKEQGYKFEGNK